MSNELTNDNICSYVMYVDYCGFLSFDIERT